MAPKDDVRIGLPADLCDGKARRWKEAVEALLSERFVPISHYVVALQPDEKRLPHLHLAFVSTSGQRSPGA